MVAALRPLGSARVRTQMRERFGITGPTASTAFGVSMKDIQRVARRARVKGNPRANHALALALWSHAGPGRYEAQMLAAFLAEPSLVTSRLMDRWVREVDNWATCDTLCMHLFDRVATPRVLGRIRAWTTRRAEFQKRAGFALLASVTLHDRASPDGLFTRFLPIIERGALHPPDDRNFVKKAVNWALRAVGARRPGLRGQVTRLARRLANSGVPSARWIGRDALRELARRAHAP